MSSKLKLSQLSAGRDQRVQDAVMAALKKAHSRVEDMDLPTHRKNQELLGKVLRPFKGSGWEEFSFGGVPCAWMRPQRPCDRRRMILYCHGGGYTTGGLDYARILASKLSAYTGLPVCAFAYRLAPESPYPAQLTDALKVWDGLMLQGFGAGDVVVAGESAGGNLALSLTLALRDAGRMLPKGMVLMSPWTDISCSGESYRSRRDDDPMLNMGYVSQMADFFAGDAKNRRDPGLSPLFARLEGLPPTLIQTGSREILVSDSTELYKRLQSAGVHARLDLCEDMWHTFQMFPMKRAAEAMMLAGRFIHDCFD